MRCLVCTASFPGEGRCPNCGYDSGAEGAREQRAILAAREEFRARTLAHDPMGRVTRKDKLVPWFGLLLGLALLLFWLRACGSVF